jgi:2-phosphosulfolactate phosphatase
MSIRIDVMFTPAEFGRLQEQDLSQSVCVVFDILRATTSMVTALANGATEIIPVADIQTALAIRNARPEVLLAGERQGWRIRADQTGAMDFDFGNSPREFTSAQVQGRSLVMTTTNGTRALRACAHASLILIGALHNLKAIALKLADMPWTNLLLVCGGTYEEAAWEDTIAAGALVDALRPKVDADQLSDGALMALELYRPYAGRLEAALRLSRNGRRLLANPELRDDVAFASRLDIVPLTPRLWPDGAVRADAPSARIKQPEPGATP